MLFQGSGFDGLVCNCDCTNVKGDWFGFFFIMFLIPKSKQTGTKRNSYQRKEYCIVCMCSEKKKLYLTKILPRTKGISLEKLITLSCLSVYLSVCLSLVGLPSLCLKLSPVPSSSSRYCTNGQRMKIGFWRAIITVIKKIQNTVYCIIFKRWTDIQRRVLR